MLQDLCSYLLYSESLWPDILQMRTKFKISDLTGRIERLVVTVTNTFNIDYNHDDVSTHPRMFEPIPHRKKVHSLGNNYLTFDYP